MHVEHVFPPMHVEHAFPPMHVEHIFPPMHVEHVIPTMHAVHAFPTMHAEHVFPPMHAEHAFPQCMQNTPFPQCMQYMPFPQCMQNMSFPQCMQNIHFPWCIQNTPFPIYIMDNLWLWEISKASLCLLSHLLYLSGPQQNSMPRHPHPSFLLSELLVARGSCRGIPQGVHCLPFVHFPRWALFLLSWWLPEPSFWVCRGSSFPIKKK